MQVGETTQAHILTFALAFIFWFFLVPLPAAAAWLVFASLAGSTGVEQVADGAALWVSVVTALSRQVTLSRFQYPWALHMVSWCIIYVLHVFWLRLQSLLDDDRGFHAPGI